MIGIDVSDWQGVIDWARVKPQIDFAILKCTQGTTFTAAYYRANKAGCILEGIPHGAYHWLNPNIDGALQADYFYHAADDPDMAVLCIDFEEYGTGAAVNLERCVKRLRELSGYDPYIYTRPSVWNTYFRTVPEWAEPCLLWIADPDPVTSPDLPLDWPSWVIWQYSWVGRIDGINSAVDLNRFNGTFDEMLAAFGNGDEWTPVPVAERVKVTSAKGLNIRSSPAKVTNIIGGANYGSVWTVMSRVPSDLGDWIQVGPNAYIAGWLTEDI